MPHVSPLARSMLRPIGSILGPLIGLILVLIIFGIWRQDRFLNGDVALSVVRDNYHVAVAAVGMPPDPTSARLDYAGFMSNAGRRHTISSLAPARDWRA